MRKFMVEMISDFVLMFCCSDRSFSAAGPRPTCMEQLATAPLTRHELHAFPALTENISGWNLVNHGAS